MHVFFINTIYGGGSTGRIVRDLGEMLEQNGHTYTVAYGRGNHSADPHGYRIGSDSSMYAHALLTRVTDRTGFYSSIATKKLIERIQEEKPDIVHLHNLHGYYLNVEVLFSFLKNEYTGKVIWTLHDCWAFTGHCTHFDFIGCEKWKTKCSHCPQKTRYPASYVFDQSTTNYLRKKTAFTGLKNLSIVTPSAWLKGKVEQSFLSEYDIKVIHNGIDLDVFHYAPSETEKDKKILLNVTDGYDERKGIKDLLKLSEELPEEYLIRIVGVDASAKEYHGKVEILPRTSNTEELCRMYQESDLFLNPTYEDTFPTVNMEAAACGLPVITYNSGGCPETIDSKCGVVVNRGDIHGLKKAILSSNFDRKICAEQGKRFDKNKAYMEYLSYYCEILGDG